MPAGGSLDAELSAKAGTGSKALIEFGGRPILETMLAAIEESGVCHRIALIGPDAVLSHPAASRATFKLAEGHTGPDNLYRGLEALARSSDPPERVLIITSDLPFVTAEMIRKFAEEAPSNRDICVPLVTKKAYEARFPGATATFVALRDDEWTTGCIYAMRVGALLKAKPHIERVFENRKSKLGMAKLLGPGFLIKFLMKSLTVVDVEKKIEALLGCSGKAMPGAAPEFAYDIDFLDDYEYALAHLGKRVAAGV